MTFAVYNCERTFVTPVGVRLHLITCNPALVAPSMTGVDHRELPQKRTRFDPS